MKTKTQNGARTDKPNQEGRTCTVQALANVAGISYTEAHETLAAQGRETGRGFTPRIAETRKAFQGRFLIHEIIDWGSTGYGQTLAQFAKGNWTGSFYVMVEQGSVYSNCSPNRLRRHMVAVVNGVVVDNLSKSWLRGRVVKVWEFEKLGKFQQAC